MHEYSLVAALIERVEQEAATRGAPRVTVTKLHVRVGELAGVETELLATAYRTFRARTVCADADLALRVIPARWECPRCAAAIEPGTPLRCPTCRTAAQLAAGDEIILERIEMEVANV
jgi:hydrogenase nickel incorporation protein HypA/HybF